MTYAKKTVTMAKDVHLFERGGVAALFSAVSLTKLYGARDLSAAYRYLKTPRSEKDAAKKIGGPLLRALESRSMIDDGSGKSGARVKAVKKAIGRFNIRNVVLLVSNNCNFRCSYCQIEENMDQKRMVNMSRDVAAKALALFKRNSNPGEKKTVTITGGEPLLNMDVVRFIIAKVRKEFKNTRIVVFTNGSLVTKELARYFKDNDILMLVSLDGPRAMYDRVRKTKAGQGSFDAAMRGYNLLKAAGCKIGVSAVGGTHNIKDVDKTFDFFLKLKPSSIGFNFSHFLLEKDNPTEVPIIDFGRILLDFYEILRSRGIFLENISRPIGAFQTNTPKVNECQAQGYGFTVDARGKVGPCKSLTVADVFSVDIDGLGRIEDNPMFRDWSLRSPFMVAECLDCPALGICGGGCAYDSYISNKGDFKGIDTRVCEYKKYVLEFLIWDLFKVIRKKAAKQKFYSPSLKEQDAAFSSAYDKKNELQRSVGHELDTKKRNKKEKKA
ncbi:MAG: radical SAM protein [Candidatus Omnitrophica bacterium]|nr:radical SAM protein [Candidatus Omnitrophota bacterium]